MLDAGLVLHLEAGKVPGAGVPVPDPLTLRMQQPLPRDEIERFQAPRVEPSQLLVELRQIRVVANRNLGRRVAAGAIEARLDLRGRCGGSRLERRFQLLNLLPIFGGKAIGAGSAADDGLDPLALASHKASPAGLAQRPKRPHVKRGKLVVEERQLGVVANRHLGIGMVQAAVEARLGRPHRLVDAKRDWRPAGALRGGRAAFSPLQADEPHFGLRHQRRVWISCHELLQSFGV